MRVKAASSTHSHKKASDKHDEHHVGHSGIHAHMKKKHHKDEHEHKEHHHKKAAPKKAAHKKAMKRGK